MKKRLSTILLVLVFLAGLSLVLYPTVSDYWNSFHQSRAIATYAEAVAAIDNEQYEHLKAEAEAYNRMLARQGITWLMNDQQKAEYRSKLDVAGGIMSYIEIPEIKCYLPIYHGTAESVLQIAVGHIEGSSLPVGGESTHCVLSGHRGLPSAKLFTDLDKLQEGDTFLLRTLDETLTYEVDQVLIVLPHEVDALEIVPGMDYCTLVTCTPYGVNSHRMLVRGHRIENAEQARSIRVTADAMQIEPLLVMPIVAAPMLLVLLIAVMIGDSRKH